MLPIVSKNKELTMNIPQFPIQSSNPTHSTSLCPLYPLLTISPQYASFNMPLPLIHKATIKIT